jgi:alpha-beta hydrolase superfamily lysophospholipase
VRKILLLSVSGTGLAVVGFTLLVGWIIAKPNQSRVGDAPADLRAEAVSFHSGPDTIVKGWWCPVEGSHGIVLLLPGIRANRLSMVERARFLRGADYSTLLIDLQGTGETQGTHVTFGWRESRDVLSAVAFLKQKAPAQPIAIIGSSLGGAAALFAIPELKVNALVLEAVYPSIGAATRNRMQKYLGPIGVALTPLLLWQLQPRLGIDARDLRPIDRIGLADCPLLVISGEKDRNTCLTDTRELFSAAAGGRKELWIVPNAGHVDLHEAAPQEYERRVLGFLEKALGAQRENRQQ